MRHNRTQRAGFTLVELLVVIGVSILLAALTVGIANSSATDSYKVVGAADRISGWLLQAKSKAQREGQPRGVRFIVNGNQCTEAQFIEVPDTFNPVGTAADPARVQLNQTAANTLTITFRGANVVAAVQANVGLGDTLALPEFGLLVPIPSSPAPASFTTASSVLPVGVVLETTSFGFHRAARPMLGEPNLQVPTDMIIDVRDFAAESATSTTLMNQTNGEFDILFKPNGEVMNATLPRFILWVRNIRLLDANTNPRSNLLGAGEMALIVIYTKTGAISTQPPMLPPNYPDPYQAAKDAVNSGL